MAFMDWKDSFSVNVIKFDVQHKKLVGLVNELHAAMSAGQGKDVMSRVLSELMKYTSKHFSDEEDAMLKFGYPDFKAHKAEHVKLTDEVLKFQKQFEGGEKNISIDVMSFLNNWLKNHIMASDKKYSEFFKGKIV